MNKKELKKKELKEKLHQYIDDTEDEEALQMLHEAAVGYGKPDEDVAEELTPEQLERLRKSQEQARNGNTYTHEEVMQKVKKWRSK